MTWIYHSRVYVSLLKLEVLETGYFEHASVHNRCWIANPIKVKQIEKWCAVSLVMRSPGLNAEDHSIPAIAQGYVKPNYERPRKLRVER